MAKLGSYYLHPVPALVGAVESLGWLTELQVAHDGSQVREQLRNYPRRTLRYRYYEKAVGPRQAGYLTQYAGVGRLWAVPLWHEAEVINVTAGTSVAIGADTRDYEVGGRVMLWSSETDYETAEIAALPTAGGITTTTPVATRTNAVVMPLRFGRVDDSISRQINERTTYTDITFQLDEVQVVAPVVPAQYASADIYWDCPLLSGSYVDVGMAQQVDKIDGETGIVVTRARWEAAQDVRSHRRVLQGQDAIYAFRGYLARRAGRYLAFWGATHAHDLRNRSTGTVTTTLFVDDDDVVDLGLDYIGVQRTTGVWSAHEVTANITASLDRAQLTITPSLGYDAAQIARISWLQHRRLDTDNVELTYIGRGVAEVTVTTARAT